MTFVLKRIDKKKDLYTKLVFETYNDAYDFLEKHFGQDCCSDLNYEKNDYYQIIEKD
tara:strand:- start:321 stop:491 length:171 start_codon:yes stop_codon:yes gene_type:complete